MSETEVADENESDVRKYGIAAAPGIAIGRAYLVDRRRLKVPRRKIDEEEVDSEIDRFKRAIKKSDKQLENIKAKIAEQQNEHYNIITAHQLILHDEHIVDETIRYIRDDHSNAEWALRKTVERIKGLFNSIEDDYFRERRSDVDFVGERILRNLVGRETSVKPPPDAIVVAHDLSPADTALLHRAAVAGLVTDAGGRTSHTAIVARAHEIPAVVGLEDVTNVANTGDLIIVDGTAGQVIINPSPELVSEFRDRARKEAAADAVLLSTRDDPAVSTDGTVVKLMANIDHVDEIKSAIDHGALGIGLFRTEFMFMGDSEYPSEDTHFDHARQVLELMEGQTATFRTIDFSADKVSRMLPELHSEANPALGLRSIRLCLTPAVLPLFRAQLRGLLRAGVHGAMRIMFPMISGVGELDAARRELDSVKEELSREGVAFADDIPVGIMIEMPAAAMIADHLAKHVDFFSIGTNDLIQYTLAVDRVNEHVSYLYQPLHPALLRLIDGVVKAAHAESISISVCGEMAGDPGVSSVLLGLGIRELSMHAVAVPQVKQLIRKHNMAELQELAQTALSLPNADRIQQLVEKTLSDEDPTEDL